MPGPLQNYLSARPKSARGHALDAVMFLAAGLAIGWAAQMAIDDGEISLRRLGEFVRADQPVLFWLSVGGCVLASRACLFPGALGVGAAMTVRRRGETAS